jgi:hypothetical protein
MDFCSDAQISALELPHQVHYRMFTKYGLYGKPGDDPLELASQCVRYGNTMIAALEAAPTTEPIRSKINGGRSRRTTDTDYALDEVEAMAFCGGGVAATCNDAKHLRDELASFSLSHLSSEGQKKEAWQGLPPEIPGLVELPCEDNTFDGDKRTFGQVRGAPRLWFCAVSPSDQPSCWDETSRSRRALSSAGASAKALAARPSTNVRGPTEGDIDRMAQAERHDFQAETKLSAGDGQGCLSELDAHDRLDPRPDSQSTNPVSWVRARVRAACLILAGKCEAGRQLFRKSAEGFRTDTGIVERFQNGIDQLQKKYGKHCQGNDVPLQGKAVTPRSTKANEGGYITINSIPVSACFVDNRPLGTTPRMSMPIPAGTHVVRFVSLDQTLSKTIAFTVKSGETTLATARLDDDSQTSSTATQPSGALAVVHGERSKSIAPEQAPESGYLTVNSIPASAFSIDGSFAGMTPSVKVPIPAGTHIVKFITFDQKSNKSIVATVNAGETTIATARLEE